MKRLIHRPPPGNGSTYKIQNRRSAAIPVNGIAALLLSTNYRIIAAVAANSSVILPARALALPRDYRFTNKTDVGGRRGKEWSYDRNSWTTIVYGPKRPLPKTGF